MTRTEASEKVAKLMRLAHENPNPNEASSARARARKIVKEHSLTLEELSAGKKARAFDDLIAALRRTLAARPGLPTGLFDTTTIMSGILTKLEKMSDPDKSRRLDEAAKLIEVAASLNDTASQIGFGSDIVTDIKKIFDETLAAHDLART